MPKIYAPRLVREARKKLKEASWSIGGRSSGVWYDEELKREREEAAKEQQHECVQWLDSLIKDSVLRRDQAKARFDAAQKQLRLVQTLFTGSRRISEPYVPAEDDVEVWQERSPHKRGWGKAYVPTRKRYWRPTCNNWKRHRTFRWRVPGISYKSVE